MNNNFKKGLVSLVGKKVSFETTDLDGNPVKSEDLFRDKKVTVINFWATWCPHCIDELPGLEDINKTLEAHGCQTETTAEHGRLSEMTGGFFLISFRGPSFLIYADFSAYFAYNINRVFSCYYFLAAEGNITCIYEQCGLHNMHKNLHI